MALTDGAVHCWDFEEVSGARTDHISGLVLVEYEGPVASIPGKVGRAAAFNGTTYFWHGGPGSPTFIPPFTVAFWLWLDSIPGVNQGVCVCRGDHVAAGYVFYVQVRENGCVAMSVGAGSRGFVLHPTPLTIGTWHLVVGWSSSLVPGDTGTTNLQIDNGPVSTTGNGLMGSGIDFGLSVGSTSNGYSTFHGKMDQLVYWNRALTDGERQTLWNNGAGIDCTLRVPPTDCEPLPPWIAYGATGGPEWGTALFAAPGGWEQRAQMFAQVRGRWDVSFLNVSKAQAQGLVDFFRAVAWGKAGSFCFMDWRDHTFDNVIGTGNGTTTTFQLVKVYTSGTLSYARPLTRPVVSSLVVTVNGVATSAYTVDAAGGLLHFTAPPPSGAVIHASGDFEVLVRFATDSLQVTCVAPDVFSCAGLGLVELIGE